MAIDPFVGCDFIVAGPMHLTLKVDYLCALSESELLPHGPRLLLNEWKVIPVTKASAPNTPEP